MLVKDYNHHYIMMVLNDSRKFAKRPKFPDYSTYSQPAFFDAAGQIALETQLLTVDNMPMQFSYKVDPPDIRERV